MHHPAIAREVPHRAPAGIEHAQRAAAGANTLSDEVNGVGLTLNAVSGALHALPEHGEWDRRAGLVGVPVLVVRRHHQSPGCVRCTQARQREAAPEAVPLVSPSGMLPRDRARMHAHARHLIRVACMPAHKHLLTGPGQSVRRRIGIATAGGRSTVPMTVKPKRTLLGASGT